MAIYIEPIEHPRAKEARLKGMTVEQLLEIEKKNSQPGVVIKDYKDAYLNLQAAIKNNPQELQRQKEGEAKAKENTARAFNGILGMSMPSTYYNLFNLDNLLSNKKALALDLGTFALLGGTGALAKQAIGKKLAQNTFENKVAKEIAEKIPAKNITVEHIKRTTGKTAFFYEPGKGAKVNTLPKGQKVPYTAEENIAFRQQINDFANKYGYEPIGTEVTDPQVLERYARSMIKRHNTFYRGVEMPSKKNYPELWKLLEDVLGTNFTKEQALKYMATHAPGGGAGELYISPYKNVASMYGDPVEIMRPFKLGKDRTRWFTEGDFKIATAGGLRDMLNFKNVKGIVDPWNTNKDLPIRFVSNELTGRNQLFIPQRITYAPKYGSKDWGVAYGDIIGSKNRPTISFTPNIQFKSGGKLNYLKFFK